MVRIRKAGAKEVQVLKWAAWILSETKWVSFGFGGEEGERKFHSQQQQLVVGEGRFCPAQSKMAL